LKLRRSKTKDNSSDGFIVFYVIFGITFSSIFGYFLFRFYLKRRIEKKTESEREQKWLEECKERDKNDKIANNIYSLIKKDFTKIARTCLFCTDDFYLDIVPKYCDIDTNKIDVIDDINNGNFSDLYSYITPDKCCHSFHYDCCTKYNYNKENINNPENCPFCKTFLTLDNMNKFGCFFSESNLRSLYPIANFKFDHL